jgi:hypothetical protein
MAQSPRADSSGASRVQNLERRLEIVVENPEEIRKLSSNDSSLVLAQSVAIAGESICNMAWQCFPIAPMTSISWRRVFGLNWTYSSPEFGSHLTLCGTWQEAKFNSVWDLRKDGYWTISDAPRVKDHIAIGNIGKLSDTFPGPSFPCKS